MAHLINIIKTGLLLSIATTCMVLPSNAQEFRTIFKEDFDDNRHAWPFIAELANSYATISDGFLQYHNRSENSIHRTYTWVPINPRRDFRIVLGVKRIAGPVNNRVGMRWGSVNSYNEFCIAFNDYYTINTYDESVGETKTIVGWTETTAIDSNIVNVLEMTKIDNDYFFAINGQLVYRGAFDQHFGEYIHLVTNAGATVAYDYVYVEEFSGSHEQSVAYVQRLENQLGINTSNTGLGASDPKGAEQAADLQRQATLQAEQNTYAILRETRKHKRNLDRWRREFVGKSYLHLAADRQRPAITGGNGTFWYYNYERVNGMQVYLEVTIIGDWIDNVNYSVRPKGN